MKSLYFLGFLSILPTLLFANPVDREKAKQIASSILGGVKQEKVALANNNDASNQTTPAYYIFSGAANKGFAIISGEDCFPEVVGYSLDGDIDKDNLPPALSDFLAAYENYVMAVREGEAVMPESYKLTTTYPLEASAVLSCTWGQDKPYNGLCPTGTVVGCVATAMAQIMYYHKWPEKGTGTGYTTGLNVNFANSTYDWAAMKDTKTENQSDENAAAAVARICLDCGVAVKMNYGSSSSAYTSDAVKAFYTNFSYNASTIRHITRDCYATQDEWMDIVKGEISAGRPVFYEAVSSSGGGSDAAGHAFIVDGYNSNDYVHVNWGWDGTANGYYDIIRLAPTGTSYSFADNQGMIIGIQPAKESAGSFIVHPYMAGGITTTTTSIDYTGVASEKFIISTPIVYNMTAVSVQGKTGIGLYDAKGTFLSSFQRILQTYSLEPNYGITSTNYSCSLPANLEDGEYAIKMFFKSGSDYIEPDVVGGQAQNYIHVTIANGKATFDNIPITDGIVNIKAEAEDASEKLYNINGQRVPSNQKGLIVGKGKKEFRK